jgi:hypothetical protein
MIEKTERFEMRVDPSIMAQVDEWRGSQPDVPNRSEAFRKLVVAGLGRAEHEQLYRTAQFNVLCAALTKGPGERLDDAYVYAWSAGVYPLFHSDSGLHKPFGDQFLVPSDKLDELSKYYDNCWREGKVPSFYKVETYYQVRAGYGFWNRSNLISASRYMFLNDMFDAAFWGALLKGSDHPTEAKSIKRPFDRQKDIYFN